jgi:quercetin dioxygenase-like cupin family protein
MRLWHLPSLAPSTTKRTPRDPGPDAPRVVRAGRQMPRVLFSSPECRVVVIDLETGEELGAHHVRERAVVEVVSGSVSIELTEEAVDCAAGTVITFEPGERHAVRALADARLLLVLAPWPKAGHYSEGERPHADVPVNATVEPDQTTAATSD